MSPGTWSKMPVGESLKYTVKSACTACCKRKAHTARCSTGSVSFPLKEALRWSSSASWPHAWARRAGKLQGLVDTSQGFSGFWVVLSPGWLKKHLTRNYGDDSHWRKRWKHFGEMSSATVSNREISFLPVAVRRKGAASAADSTLIAGML